MVGEVTDRRMIASEFVSALTIVGGSASSGSVRMAPIASRRSLAAALRSLEGSNSIVTRLCPALLCELIETTPERDGVGGNAWLRVVLGEGRSRQVRRMMESVGHKVSKLRRVAIGPIRDRKIPPGGFSDLDPAEVAALQAL